MKDIEEDIVQLYEKDVSNHKTSKLFLTFAAILVFINFYLSKN